MANYVATMNALRGKLAEFTALPLYWPNDSRAPSPADAPLGFVFSEGRILDETPITLGPNGARFHRDYGEFMVYVYVPRKSKIGQAETWAQQIRELFGLTAIDGIHITSRVIEAGDLVDSSFGQYYAIPIRIEFNTDRLE